jgi:hypothetical protein
MLGIPSGFGLAGTPFLVVGIVAAVVVVWRWRASLPSDFMGRAASACMVFTVAVTPYLAYRIVEDIRLTSSMSAYELSVAGPVQAYLQPYLLDPLRTIIPPGDTYSVATGPGAPNAVAAGAFPSLAMMTLFPRKAVADPRHADWVIVWGTPPPKDVPLGRVIVARGAQAGYPAVLVGRVRR